MQLRSATKVGLAVLTSLGALFVIWYFVLGQGFKRNSYIVPVSFRDAQNVTPGAEVRMAGVVIGAVDSIRLSPDNKALLQLRIARQFQIPSGSGFVITSGGLIGEKYVSIIPREQAKGALPENLTEPVEGQETVQIEGLMAKASQLAASSNQVIQEAQLALRDTRATVRAMGQLVGDPKLQKTLHALLDSAELSSANIANATRRADQTAAAFQNLANSVQPSIKETVVSMNKSADNVEQLTSAISGIVSGEDVKSGLGSTLNNLKTASAELPALAAKMTTIASNLEKLSGDPTLTGDLKAALANVRASTDQALQAATAVNQTVQKLTGRYRRARNPGASENPNASKDTIKQQTTLDLVQNVDPGHFRADVNAVLPMGKKNFVTGGVFGVADTNRLNLQMGQTLGDGWSARYGVYRGWLGIGLDTNLGQPNGLTMNAYRPNHLDADVYYRKRLKDDTSLLIGVENLLHSPKPTIGIRIRH